MRSSALRELRQQFPLLADGIPSPAFDSPLSDSHGMSRGDGMSLEYLSKYLNKDSDRSKKRKRPSKHIVEDNLTGWSKQEHLVEDGEAPVVVSEHVSSSSSSKTTGFKPAYRVEKSADDSAVSDSAIKSKIRGDEVMQNGARAGLQTKEQVLADIKARREAERLEIERANSLAGLEVQETVYRDATGRRIDIALAKRDKALEAKREEERKSREQELSRGLVQQRERQAKAAELAAVRSQGFSRYAGDADAEAALKAKTQWNDPAAQFLSSKGGSGGRPTYTGGFAPNRFSIRPGYRWDGVDRGNGFEAKRFKAMAALEQRKAEYNDWAREDM